MKTFPDIKPNPDFDELKRVLGGDILPKKVHFAELFFDEEIKKYIVENYFDEVNYPPFISTSGDIYVSNSNISNTDNQNKYKNYYKQLVNFWYRMGHSFMVDHKFIIDFCTLTDNCLESTKDTGIYSKEKRSWARKGNGIIKSWDDFEKFPWENYKNYLNQYADHLNFLSKNLPEGMKIVINGIGLYEFSLERFFGYENFFYFIYDHPDLLKSVVDMIGKINYELYSNYITHKDVGAILVPDDLGFKTSSMISIKKIKELFFPWYKKYSLIAHKYNKNIWMHCCGYKYDIIDYLIKEVEIDAIHGFEDSNSPIIDFKQKYGNEISLLGGVDIDKLVRFNEENLRKYIREILEVCMVGGRFALGSGNSFCNYIPIENYFIMLEEGLKWC